MTQSPNGAVSFSFLSYMFDFPRLTEKLFISFSISLSSLMKSLALHLRSLCSRSQQGNENKEIKALETRSVY